MIICINLIPQFEINDEYSPQQRYFQQKIAKYFITIRKGCKIDTFSPEGSPSIQFSYFNTKGGKMTGEFEIIPISCYKN
jgi:hypothetical protein